MASWNDYNDASQNPNLIPKGTIARVRLTIRPGGYDDPSQGWTGGYATRGSTGAVYLNGEFTVLEGPYARRKIFTLIGLYSPKGPDWANMGRSLIRGMLNSARGISDKDVSPQAQAARRISGFADLDGLEFVARIDIGTDANGEPVPLFDPCCGSGTLVIEAAQIALRQAPGRQRRFAFERLLPHDAPRWAALREQARAHERPWPAGHPPLAYGSDVA
ncbi:MAG: hypothetical protein ACK4MT_08910, partial [Thermaurantiacus tibetensis]